MANKEIKKHNEIVDNYQKEHDSLIGLIWRYLVDTYKTEIENHKKRLFELKKEKQKMIVELADLKSIQALDSKDSGFIVINHKDIAYVTSISSVVAMK